ncbi:phosphate ABC transporter substrate-binding protein [Tannockella kyphosi]|uniref:phosphate ABC transporter substrate-binding protein n=1 Tax=Tannockella kyphosi TaxID=2899121 RepID=UPI00201144E0|nr:phosphate ABC transporter substrate-binding protein [Tannockella kyphosi]
MKKLLTGALVLMLALGVTGCSSDDSESGDDTAAVSGTVTMNGSTSMEDLVESIIETLASTNPELTISCEYTGSSSGTAAAIEGTANIGNASRNLKDEELETLTENIVAYDGIAVIVSADMDASGIDLSMDDLAAIYKGEITNWSEVGGEDMAIVVIGRDSASGTRGAFEEIVGVEDECAYGQEIESTGAVIGKVTETEGAIGYVSLNVVADYEDVQALSLDGAEASSENISNGTYLLFRPFVMATVGTIEEQSEAVQFIFDFISSEDGQAIISTLGLISAE